MFLYLYTLSSWEKMGDCLFGSHIQTLGLIQGASGHARSPLTKEQKINN